MSVHRIQFVTVLCSIQSPVGMSNTILTVRGRINVKASDSFPKRTMTTQEQIFKEEVSYILQNIKCQELRKENKPFKDISEGIKQLNF